MYLLYVWLPLDFIRYQIVHVTYVRHIRRDHPFRTSANLYDFRPLSPPIGSFYATISRQIWRIFDPSLPHWLYRFLEGKKTSRFLFSVPGLQGSHLNLKKKYFSISVRAFLENSLIVIFILYFMYLADPEIRY